MTLETRPHIPVAAPPQCPNRTMELNHTSHTNRKRRTRADGVLNHQNVKKKKEKQPTTIYIVAEFELCCANLQEMSGTACSDMWGLRSSSDLLSDRLSPCNLETTHNAIVHTGSQANIIAQICIFQQQNRGACLENKWEIRERQAGLYQSGVMRQKGSV